MIGQVIRSDNSRYGVLLNNQEVKCVARGILKTGGKKILVGDYVEVNDGVILRVLPRKNLFKRPYVANVESIAIVVASSPKPDFVMVDKLLTNAAIAELPVIIIVNKTDLGNDVSDYVKSVYGKVVNKIVDVSTESGYNINVLKDALNGKLTVLAGQSAVGKTSLINSVFGTSNKVGGLSEKTLRGRHTTTYSEIFSSDDLRVIDSPGFAVINADSAPSDLQYTYPEFALYVGKCRFRSCTHTYEPVCAVKSAVYSGLIHKDRYERFLIIYNELLREKKHNA